MRPQGKPTLTLAHVGKTLLLVTMGDLDAALESAKRAHDADPLQPLATAAEVNVRLGNVSSTPPQRSVPKRSNSSRTSCCAVRITGSLSKCRGG